MALTFRIKDPGGKNGGGYYNSICVHCFATIASKKNEAELEKHEQKHVCEQAMSQGWGMRTTSGLNL